MALISIDDVLEEGGFSYTDFGFSDNTTFRSWISKRITWIDGKILTLVGATNYNAGITDIEMAEVFWVISTMLSRKQSSLTTSIEGGFAIGSLRIDNASPATRGVVEFAQSFFKKAMTLLAPYASLTRADFLVVQDEEDDDELDYPPDRFWFRQA